MRVVSKQERGTAIQAKGITGIPDGVWLVNLEGHAGTIVLMGEDFERRFVEDMENGPGRVITEATRTTLEVPPAREGWNTRPISDRILATVTATPMAARDIVAAVDPGHASNVRGAIRRLKDSGKLKAAGRGKYRLGAVK